MNNKPTIQKPVPPANGGTWIVFNSDRGFFVF